MSLVIRHLYKRRSHLIIGLNEKARSHIEQRTHISVIRRVDIQEIWEN
ncbi:MAG: hypothetical protein RLP02_04125 [Coleofasciculus sp. C2-GNP5-27]